MGTSVSRGKLRLCKPQMECKDHQYTVSVTGLIADFGTCRVNWSPGTCLDPPSTRLASRNSLHLAHHRKGGCPSHACRICCSRSCDCTGTRQTSRLCPSPVQRRHLWRRFQLVLAGRGRRGFLSLPDESRAAQIMPPLLGVHATLQAAFAVQNLLSGPWAFTFFSLHIFTYP